MNNREAYCGKPIVIVRVGWSIKAHAGIEARRDRWGDPVYVAICGATSRSHHHAPIGTHPYLQPTDGSPPVEINCKRCLAMLDNQPEGEPQS